MWRHARNRQQTLSKWARQCQQMMAYYGKINISQMVSSNVPETICKTVRSSTLVSHSQWMKWWLLEKGCLEWFKFTNWWMWIIMLIDKLILYYIHRYPVFSLFCVDSEWLVSIWIIPDQPWPLVDAKSRVWVTRPRQRQAGLCSAPCCAPRFSTFLPTQFPSKNGKKIIIHLVSLKTGPIVKIVSFRR